MQAQVGNTTLIIGGSGITNNGTITVNSNNAASATTLRFDTNGTLGGNGTLVLNRAGTLSLLSSGAGVTITHAATHTVRGQGRISGSFINLGLVQADVDSETMNLASSGTGFDNQGTVKVNTGSTISASGGYKQTAGETQVDGTVAMSTGTFNLLGGELKGTGTVNGTVNNQTEGTVNPGNSTGTLTVNGVYNQAGQGILKVELGGIDAGQFDKLVVAGNNPNGVANLSGKLEAELIGGFTPALGDSFEVLTYRVRNGKFTEFDRPDAPPGTMWTMVYGTNNLTLIFTIEGDD